MVPAERTSGHGSRSNMFITVIICVCILSHVISQMLV